MRRRPRITLLRLLAAVAAVGPNLAWDAAGLAAWSSGPRAPGLEMPPPNFGVGVGIALAATVAVVLLGESALEVGAALVAMQAGIALGVAASMDMCSFGPAAPFLGSAVGVLVLRGLARVARGVRARAASRRGAAVVDRGVIGVGS